MVHVRETIWNRRKGKDNKGPSIAESHGRAGVAGLFETFGWCPGPGDGDWLVDQRAAEELARYNLADRQKEVHPRLIDYFAKGGRGAFIQSGLIKILLKDAPKTPGLLERFFTTLAQAKLKYVGEKVMRIAMETRDPCAIPFVLQQDREALWGEALITLGATGLESEILKRFKKDASASGSGAAAWLGGDKARKTLLAQLKKTRWKERLLFDLATFGHPDDQALFKDRKTEMNARRVYKAVTAPRQKDRLGAIAQLAKQHGQTFRRDLFLTKLLTDADSTVRLAALSALATTCPTNGEAYAFQGPFLQKAGELIASGELNKTSLKHIEHIWNTIPNAPAMPKTGKGKKKSSKDKTGAKHAAGKKAKTKKVNVPDKVRAKLETLATTMHRLSKLATAESSKIELIPAKVKASGSELLVRGGNEVAYLYDPEKDRLRKADTSGEPLSKAARLKVGDLLKRLQGQLKPQEKQAEQVKALADILESMAETRIAKGIPNEDDLREGKSIHPRIERGDKDWRIWQSGYLRFEVKRSSGKLKRGWGPGKKTYPSLTAAISDLRKELATLKKLKRKKAQPENQTAKKKAAKKKAAKKKTAAKKAAAAKKSTKPVSTNATQTKQSALRKGDWVVLARYGFKKKKEPTLWRVLKRAKGHVVLISHYVLAQKAFDTDKAIDGGNNRWRDSTLRHWLNSDAAAGKVDFGPHAKPTVKTIYSADFPYAKEQGYLAYFTKAERAALVPVSIDTPVAQHHGGGTDTTEDRVFIVTYDQYKKLPASFKAGMRTALYEKVFGSVFQTESYWARTPNYGPAGVFIVSHWSNDPRSMNAGAYCENAVRPCIALGSESFTGSGTQEDPYKPVLG